MAGVLTAFGVAMTQEKPASLNESAPPETAPVASVDANSAESNRPPNAVTWTERALLDRLRARLSRCRGGNGPEWVYAEHVRSSSGFDVLNTIDALAMHLWRSKHHEVHAFEVKISKADFRRELENDCAKSHIWRQWVEKFWIVAPADVVPVEELPDEWGLLVTHGDGLRVRKPAKRLREAPIGYMPAADLPRDIVAPFLRAAYRTAERPADPSRFVPEREWSISEFMDEEADSA